MRAIVVDDEPLARRGIGQLLAREPDVEIVGECDSADVALDAIARLQPDVVFLDVQMPGLDGVSLVRSVDAVTMPLFVFVTAHSNYAAEAFDVQAVDYVLKPVEARRLARACGRVREVLVRRTNTERLDQPDEAGTCLPATAVTTPIRNRMVVHTDERAMVVKPSEIDWFEAAGNYVKIHSQRSVYVVRETLNNLERTLREEPFARIHRSTLVNLDSIKELQPWFSGEMIVIMKDGTRLKLSRTYRRLLEARIPTLA
jgi:two-component system LytT family response regulator